MKVSSNAPMTSFNLWNLTENPTKLQDSWLDDRPLTQAEFMFRLLSSWTSESGPGRSRRPLCVAAGPDEQHGSICANLYKKRDETAPPYFPLIKVSCHVATVFLRGLSRCSTRPWKTQQGERQTFFGLMCAHVWLGGRRTWAGAEIENGNGDRQWTDGG